MDNLNLTAVWKSSYSKDGQKRHAYLLEGDDASIKFYLDTQGEYGVVDKETGKPVFTCPASSFIGKSVPLEYNPNTTKKFFIDREQFELDLLLQRNKAKASGISDADFATGLAKAGQQMDMFSQPAKSTAPAEEEDMDLGNLGG